MDNAMLEKLARSMAGSESVTLHVQGACPATNGARMWIPQQMDEGLHKGFVAGLAAIVARSDPFELAAAAADPLAGRFFCALEYARRMPDFSGAFAGAPSKARAAALAWVRLGDAGELGEEESWVAKACAAAHGFELGGDGELASVGAASEMLFDRAKSSGGSRDSCELAVELAIAFRKRDEDPPESEEGKAGGEAAPSGESSPQAGSDAERGDGENKEQARASLPGSAKRERASAGKQPGDGERSQKAADGAASKDGGAAAGPEAKGPDCAPSAIDRKVDAAHRAEDFIGGCFESIDSREGSGGASQGWEWERPACEGGAALAIPMFVDLDVVASFDGKGDRRSEMDLRRLAAPLVQPMVAKLSRALKASERVAWRLEKERGRLNARSLAKLSASPGFRAPFKEREIASSDSVAVCALLDLSGSMHGENVEMARIAAMALAVALGRLGIACEVLGFSSGPCAAYQRRVKALRLSADARRALREGRSSERLELRVFKSFAGASLRGLSQIEVDAEYCENPDGECVAWAGARLAAQRAKRKILLVLSDGAPESKDNGPSVLAKDLRSRLGALERAGIEAVGIGIGDDNVRQFYSRSIVVRKPADLALESLAQLSSLLLASARA